MCSHQWIDPNATPIARAPISTIIGTKPHQMQIGTLYVCQRCDATTTPK